MAFHGTEKITYFSKYIPKAKVAVVSGDTHGLTAAGTISADICEFNAIRRDAFSMFNNKPDFETASQAKSRIHAFLGEKYMVNNTYYHAAEYEGYANWDSARECQKLNIEDKEARLKKINEDIAAKKKRLTYDQKGKACLVKRSKNKKHYKYPLQPHSDRITETDDGRFMVRQGKKTSVYDNAYLFEVQFLTPEIAQLERDIRNKELRAARMENELDALKQQEADGRVSVCFGTKDLFYKQFADGCGHEAWKRHYGRQRNSGMTIVGCAQAKQGNYAFRYDVKTHALAYTSFHGVKIVIPDVVFPYGQENVYNAVLAGKGGAWDTRMAVSWRIEEHGNDFLIKCMPTLPPAPDNSISVFRACGCFGIDQNYDNISLAEADKNGNLVSHHVFPFDLEGLSSGQVTAVLSAVLDEAFDIIAEAGKPVVYEDIGNIKKVLEGGDPNVNYKLSMFAHGKISALIKGKAYRAGIPVRKVNPRFTSQIGKAKYMKKYGLTVHEAAAFVIARRGMGFKEKIFPSMCGMVPAEKRNRHHWSHWNALFPALKVMHPCDMYHKIPYGDYSDARRLKKDFRAMAQPP